MSEIEGPSRKNRENGSMYFGDVDFDADHKDFAGEATWGDVVKGCCSNSGAGWATIFAQLVGVAFFSYWFFWGLDMLNVGAMIVGGCQADNWWREEPNAVTSLMIGILLSALFHSSTFAIKLLVAVNVAGSAYLPIISARQSIFVVMGANIGVGVTSSVLSLGHMLDGKRFERTFAAASLYDMYALLSCAIIFPIECATGYLYHISKALADKYDPEPTDYTEDPFEGPVRLTTWPLTNKVIIANENLRQSNAYRAATTILPPEYQYNCDSAYPIVCLNPDEPSYNSCLRVGLIGCDKHTGDCPAFFDVNATLEDDQRSGYAACAIGLVVCFISMWAFIKIATMMVQGMSTRIIHKATNLNGYALFLGGAVLTVLVQSTAMVTSVFAPYVGVGLLQLDQMLPIVMGAGFGTSINVIGAAMLRPRVAVQFGIADLFYNLTAFLIWYPLPMMRQVPIHAARQLGKATRMLPVGANMFVAFFYIAILFILFPLMMLGISDLFEEKEAGKSVLGSFLVILIIGVLAGLAFMCKSAASGIDETPALEDGDDADVESPAEEAPSKDEKDSSEGDGKDDGSDEVEVADADE